MTSSTAIAHGAAFPSSDETSHRESRDSSACRLVGLLGEGGMARVYLAHHEGLDRPVAVKRLRPQLANMPHARDRLLAEAQIVREVKHDHVVSVLDVVSEPDGESYFVMEHLAGEPLSSRIARAGVLPLSEVLTIGLQVADALRAVHARGVIHRDLKTENVLVSLDGSGRMVAKLIDFGVAEMLGEGHQIISSAVVGTPESMAPEQARGGAVDHRCDIYSFGVLLFEMITGGAPFRDPEIPVLLQRVIGEEPVRASATPGGQRQHIPAELDDLIHECLAKKPAGRPQRMAEVKARLEQIAADHARLVAAIEAALLDEADDPPRAGEPAAAPARPSALPAALIVDEADAGPDQPIEPEEPEPEEPSDPIEPDEPADPMEPTLPAAAAADEPDDPAYATGERAWFAEGEEMSEEAAAEARASDAVEEWSQRIGFASPVASVQLGRVAGAALFIAAVAAGLLGLMGYMLWSPMDVEALWP